MTDDQRSDIMEKCVSRLSEIYDSVQIVGTWLDESGRTRGQKRGSGNWYARQQLCREFIEENQIDESAKAIARELEPPDDWKPTP